VIQFPRSLARQLRAIFRRCVRKANGSAPPLVEFHASTDGLQVQLVSTEFAIRFSQLGSFIRDTAQLPLTALADVEGSGSQLVSVENAGPNKVAARWDDGGVPRFVEYDLPAGDHPPLPDPPERFVSNPPALLKALDEAVKTTAVERVKFALDRVQLRGKVGEIAATDSKQALIQGGFSFPWEGDLLVTRLPVFGLSELGQNQSVEVGRTDGHVVLRTGSWTFWLLIDTQARFPSIKDVIPFRRDDGRCWHIAPEDGVFLARTLPKMPTENDHECPLTVDPNGHVALRSRGENQGRVTEAVLSHSRYTGSPLRFLMNRKNLLRAIQLGFKNVDIASPDRPLVCRDERRTFFFMPLPPSQSIPPTEDALRVVSGEAAPTLKTVPTEERKRPEMPTIQPPRDVQNSVSLTAPGKPSNDTVGQPNTGNSGLIAEAQALKELARDLFARSCKLVSTIRKHRQQSKLVASTISSLRQLQAIDA